MKKLALFASLLLLIVAGCAGCMVQYDKSTQNNKKSEVELCMERQAEILTGALDCESEDALYVAEQFSALELGAITSACPDEDKRSFWKCVSVEAGEGGCYTLCIDKSFLLSAVRKDGEYIYRTLQ